MANNGPVKNATEARVYLEQHVLIAINNNYTPESLANILFVMAIEGKIPEHVSSVIKVVGFLLMAKLADSSSAELVTTFTGKLLPISQSLIKDLESKCDFIKATAAKQSRHTLRLAEVITPLTTAAQSLKSTNQAIANASKEITPLSDTITTVEKLLQSLMESTKALSDISSKLRKNLPPHIPLEPTTNNQCTTYANIASNHPQFNNASPANHISTQPVHIQQLINRLSITQRQVYITYDSTDPKTPKERNGPATHLLCTKLKDLLQQQKHTSDPTTDNLNTIRTLRFMEQSAVLLKLESVQVVCKFQTLCEEQGLLSTLLCPSVTFTPHAYRVILHFVPCNGSFNPSDYEHLHQIEEDLNLPPHSITSTSWIKKPELRSPNQKMANVKLTCSLAEAANKFLSE